MAEVTLARHNVAPCAVLAKLRSGRQGRLQHVRRAAAPAHALRAATLAFPAQALGFTKIHFGGDIRMRGKLAVAIKTARQAPGVEQMIAGKPSPDCRRLRASIRKPHWFIPYQGHRFLILSFTSARRYSDF